MPRPVVFGRMSLPDARDVLAEADDIVSSALDPRDPASRSGSGYVFIAGDVLAAGFPAH
jgi:hypothetical protein